MFCTSCGAELNPSLKFCENCGAPVQVAPVQAAPVDQSTVPAEPAAPAEPTAPAYVAEVPGDSAWQAQSQQAYQEGQTSQIPPLSEQGSSFFQSDGAPQPPTYQMPPQNRAPNAAFVLVIVGLVLSALFVTFLPGLVCSIIGLVLNAGYKKKGLDNPHKTSTTVLGIIGIVIGVLSLVLAIFIGVVTAQVVDEIDRQGIDITTESVEVTTDSSGHINISVKDSSDSAVSGVITIGSSASASSAASSASASPALAVYDDSKYHDTDWNPTLYPVVELSGSELQDLLEYYNFKWDKTISAWTAYDGSQLGVYDKTSLLDKDEIEALPQGAAGQPVAIGLTVEGYNTPSKAFDALAKDVAIEDKYGDDEVLFAVVSGSPGVHYLVAVTETDNNEQTFLVFTDESIAGGVFERIVGVNAGSTMDEVWQAITGGSHIGGAARG